MNDGESCSTNYLLLLIAISLLAPVMVVDVLNSRQVFCQPQEFLG